MYSSLPVYVIAVAILLEQSAGELVIAPRVTEARVGDTTYFNCSTNLTSKEIFWYHGQNYIYIGDMILPPYEGRFEIDLNASLGSHNLVIHSVEHGDAGQYICADDDGFGTKRSAELVVLETDPYCQSNMQPDGVIGPNMFSIPPDEVQLTCSVTFHGNIPPLLEWKKVGEMSSIKHGVISNVTSNRLIYTLKLEGDVSLDKSSYICQTARSTENQYQCTSETMKALYYVRGDATEETVFRGETIACITRSNTFSCINQWYHSNSSCPLSCNESITTHFLGEYICTVKCNVRGSDHFVEVLKVFVVDEPAPPQALTYDSNSVPAFVVPIVIVIVVGLLTALIAVVVFYKRRKSKVSYTKARNVEEAIKFTIDFAHDVTVDLVDKEKRKYIEATGLDPNIFNENKMAILKKLIAISEGNPCSPDTVETEQGENSTIPLLASGSEYHDGEMGDIELQQVLTNQEENQNNELLESRMEDCDDDCDGKLKTKKGS